MKLFPSTARIFDALQTCYNGLKPGKDSIPADVSNAMEKIAATCKEKFGAIKEIFETVIQDENDTSQLSGDSAEIWQRGQSMYKESEVKRKT